MTDRRKQLLAIHERVLGNDPSASAALFASIHRALVGVLLKSFRQRRLREDQASDLATDAIVDYLRSPQRFDPNKASLYSYLAIIAKRDALNLLDSIFRERQNFDRFVELGESDRNIVYSAADASIDAERIITRYGQEIVDDEFDVAVLRLVLSGEKDTDAYAAAIGHRESPSDVRHAAVKQRRDKIEKRLQRLRDRL